MLVEYYFGSTTAICPNSARKEGSRERASVAFLLVGSITITTAHYYSSNMKINKQTNICGTFPKICDVMQTYWAK